MHRKVIHLKLNCWDFHKCGREPGGKKADSEGECPTASCEAFDGINGGRNGGRYCWRVTDTHCTDHDGASLPNWADKMKDCLECDFFNLVREEEGEDLNI
jgi:hypothetical protein